MITEYYILVGSPGRAYTTAKLINANNQEVIINMDRERIGPFGSIPLVSDYISKHGLPHNTYTIERMHRITPPV